MFKSIYFIVLTHFFQFNQLKILRQPGYFNFFFKLNQQYFFTVRVFGATECFKDTSASPIILVTKNNIDK